MGTDAATPGRRASVSEADLVLGRRHRHHRDEGRRLRPRRHRRTAHGEAPLSASTSPEPGAAVQDPEAIWEATGDAVRDAVADLDPARVAAVSFSSAMHGLLALDARGDPLGPLLTWADQPRGGRRPRPSRRGTTSLALHRRTGTPVHPMSPLVKLAWLRRARPSLHAAARTSGAASRSSSSHRATGVAGRPTPPAPPGTGLLDVATGHVGPRGPRDLAGISADAAPRSSVAPTAVVGSRLPGTRLGPARAASPSSRAVATARWPTSGSAPSVPASRRARSARAARCASPSNAPPWTRADGCSATAWPTSRWVVGRGDHQRRAWSSTGRARRCTADVDDAARRRRRRARSAPTGCSPCPHLLRRARAALGHRRRRGPGRPAPSPRRRATSRAPCSRGSVSSCAWCSTRCARRAWPIGEVRATGGFARSALWRQPAHRCRSGPARRRSRPSTRARPSEPRCSAMQGVGLLDRRARTALVDAAERDPARVRRSSPGPDASGGTPRASPLFEQVLRRARST